VKPIYVLGAAALVGAGIWYATRKPSAKTTGFPVAGNVHTPEEFGFALLALGYPTAVGMPGWRYTDAQTKAEVAKFQTDYNAVRILVARESGTSLGDKDLRTDGVVDRGTVMAVQLADDLVVKGEFNSWYSIVEWARTGELPQPP